MRYGCILIAVFLLVPAPLGAQATATETKTYEGLNATLWVSTAAEYFAAAQQAYHLATLRLQQALDDPLWTAAEEQEARGGYAHLPPAIILDVDETVLDNVPYQAGITRRGESFSPESWTRWVNQAEAKPVPGATDFILLARKLGVTVFFVTNRDAEHEEATRANLKAEGLPVEEDFDNVLLRDERPEWGGDKASRREYVADDYRILLLLGDDANDFVSGTRGDRVSRGEVVRSHRSKWGKQWILLPNPTYGGWESAIVNQPSAAADDEERLQRKLQALGAVAP